MQAYQAYAEAAKSQYGYGQNWTVQTAGSTSGVSYSGADLVSLMKSI